MCEARRTVLETLMNYNIIFLVRVYDYIRRRDVPWIMSRENALRNENRAVT